MVQITYLQDRNSQQMWKTIMVNGESGVGEGISLEIGIDIQTLPYVSNEDLLHFTAQGNLLNTL